MKKQTNKAGQDKIGHKAMVWPPIAKAIGHKAMVWPPIAKAIGLQALKESEARFRSIVLWSPDAIIVTDAKGKIEYINPSAEGVFNRKVESFIGEDFGLPLVDGESTEIDIFRPGKDLGVGDMHVVETEWLNKKAHLITIRDITKRKKTEEALRVSEEKHRVLIQTLPYMTYEIDVEGRFIFVSDGAKQLGYTSEELIGKHFKEIVHPDDFEIASRFIILPKYRGKTTGAENSPKLFDERRTNGRITQHLQIRLLRKSQNEAQGDYCYCEIASTGKWDSSVEDKDKNFLGSIGLIQDISERKKMEEEAQKRLQELEVFYKASIGREERILELKKEIEMLKKELGK